MCVCVCTLSTLHHATLTATLCTLCATQVQSGAASRAVRPEEVEALAAKHRAHLFEASAKQGEGVADIFACIVQQHHAR